MHMVEQGDLQLILERVSLGHPVCIDYCCLASVKSIASKLWGDFFTTVKTAKAKSSSAPECPTCGLVRAVANAALKLNAYIRHPTQQLHYLYSLGVPKTIHTPEVVKTVTAFDWIDVQNWFAPLWKAETLTKSHFLHFCSAITYFLAK